jgi:hypothetical protein
MMIEPKSLTEQLMYCTARIVALNGAGAITKTGSGFFYEFPNPKDVAQKMPLLVTNNHVVSNMPKVEFVMHTAPAGGKKPDGKSTFSIEQKDWVPHPNTKVDLCAAPIGPIINAANPPPFYRTIDPSVVPTDAQLEALNAVEEILMVGYPNGLWDATNNYPLIRRGITASHPGVDFDVNGVAATVVDMACFPGSSGSPVILHSDGAYTDKNGNLIVGTRTLFLGVLFSGPVMQADGKIVVRNIPTTVEPVAQINLMMNLGYIIKSKELDALGKAVLVRHGL